MLLDGINLIFVGPPGAGKGTQAKILSEYLSIPQISTGDILRAAVRDRTPMGMRAKSYMDSGALVPDDVVVGIAEERLMASDCERGFILDGFPRTVAQAEALAKLLKKMGRQIRKVISITVEEDDLIERIGGRRACPKCGKVYHLVNDPPKNNEHCDTCAVPLYQRDDDKKETMRKRLQEYRQKTAPLIEFYTKMGLLAEVSGAGTIDEIQQNIRRTIEGVKVDNP